MKLTDGKIRLRAPEPEDLDVLFNMENDTALWLVSGNAMPYSRYQLRKYIEESAHDFYSDRQIRFMIVLESDANVLALINVPGWTREPRKDVQERLEQPFPSSDPLECPMTTHWLNNMNEDRVLGTLASMGFCNRPEDKVKVLFVPCYLDGRDGIFNLSYYDLLIGQDLAVFPSYYEPWGYTPLESAAFRVPTVTSDLAGFGLWVNTQVGRFGLLSDGVKVVHRTDDNWNDAVSELRDCYEQWIAMSPCEREKARASASDLAGKALWKHFITYYMEAYDLALSKVYDNI